MAAKKVVKKPPAKKPAVKKKVTVVKKSTVSSRDKAARAALDAKNKAAAKKKPAAKKKAPAKGGGGGKAAAKGKGKGKGAGNEKQDDALAAYGWSKAMINSSPELKGIFDQAVKGDWSPAKFVAKVQNTKWFTQHSASWRETEALRLTDPATWRENKNTMTSGVGDLAGSMGANLSGAMRNQIAETALRMGWDEHQLRDHMAKYVQTVQSGDLAGQYIGDAGSMQMALQAMAKRNNYTLNDGSMQTWVRSVAAGEASMEDYQQFIRRQTAATYSAFADEIMAGADLADVASPYTNAYAQLLELPGQDVDLLKDPTIQRALNYRDPKTGKIGAQTIHEFQDQVRKDARWQFTDNAHEQALGLGSRVLQTMGLGGYS